MVLATFKVKRNMAPSFNAPPLPLMTVSHPVDKIRMTVLSSMGEALLRHGWNREELMNLGYTQEETDETTEYEYEDYETSTVLSAKTVASEMVTELMTELTTSAFAAVPDIVTDQLVMNSTDEGSPIFEWETVVQNGARMASLVSSSFNESIGLDESESVTIREIENHTYRFSAPENRVSYYMKDHVLVLILLVTVAIILLATSKYMFTMLKTQIFPHVKSR